jgi:ornithine cyclodeaminase/alanine dehydrogenase-like protein (mu-crystallin family)
LRLLSRADVEAALDLDALVDELAAAFAAISAGEASMPPRTGVEVPGTGTILLMGAHRHESDAVTVKLVSVFPRHDPAHQASIVVIDAATGAPAALMDGDAITAARTAAGSRLATRMLARDDADVLAVIGTGVQGKAHLTAMKREREWAEIRVWGRRDERPVEDAVRGAGVVCIATSATEPVLLREHVDPGTHVNSVGFTTEGRELDPALVRDSLVVVESRDSALASPPAGSTDLEGAEAHAELGEIVAGTRPGRTGDEQLTLYKSVGVALEDDAAARLALRGAEERGLGRVVEL